MGSPAQASAGPRATSDLSPTEAPITRQTRFVSEQISRFGSPAWDEQFVRLAEIKSLPGCALKGEALQRAIWKALPNSRFKRFQQAFSSDETLVVPKPVVLSSNKVRFEESNAELKELSVRGTIVDPEKVPTKLMADLGFISDGTDQAAQRAKIGPVEIARLKQMWDSAHFFKRTDLRLMAVEPATRDIQQEHKRSRPPLADPGVAAYGTVLLTRGKSGKTEGIAAPLVVAHYTKVYAAHRKTYHQDESYSDETLEIRGMRAELRRFTTTLLREWSDAPIELKQILAEEASRLGKESLKSLKGCASQHKIEAKEFLEGIDGAMDCTGRVNPIGTIRKINASLRRLQLRVEDVLEKTPFNVRDRRLLEQRIGTSEQLMRGFRDRIEERAELLNDEHILKLLTPKRTNVSPIIVKGVMARLGIHADDLLGVRMRPSRTFARMMRKEIGNLEKALGKGNIPKAKQAMRHLQVTAKLHMAVVGIEHLKKKAALTIDVPVEELHDFSRDLRSALLSDRVFPEVAASEEFQPLQRRMIGTVASVEAMTKRLRTYRQQRMSPEEVTRMRTRFKKKFLDKFTIEEDLLP